MHSSIKLTGQRGIWILGFREREWTRSDWNWVSSFSSHKMDYSFQYQIESIKLHIKLNIKLSIKSNWIETNQNESNQWTEQLPWINEIETTPTKKVTTQRGRERERDVCREDAGNIGREKRWQQWWERDMTVKSNQIKLNLIDAS